MLFVILMGKKWLECFTKMNCKKQFQKSLELKKIIKINHDKLYVRQEGYNNLLNSQVDKKDMV